jgi:hypothetical protein
MTTFFDDATEQTLMAGAPCYKLDGQADTTFVRASSGDDYYMVTEREPGHPVCSCRGFNYRQRCRHLELADRADAWEGAIRALVAAGLTADEALGAWGRFERREDDLADAIDCFVADVACWVIDGPAARRDAINAACTEVVCGVIRRGCIAPQLRRFMAQVNYTYGLLAELDGDSVVVSNHAGEPMFRVGRHRKATYPQGLGALVLSHHAPGQLLSELYDADLVRKHYLVD